MLVSKITEEDLTVDIVHRLLFQGIDDPGDKADCILVLGSIKASKYRVPVAVDAYKAGRSGKLMLCGGALRNFPDGTCSEAQHMYKTALEMGIPAEDIILENASQNTVENILYALIELQRTFWLNNVHRVLLVTTAYHMRRSLAIARYLFPAHVQVIPCPAEDTHTRRDNWTETPTGLERAKNEAMNIIRYIQNGVIPDFEL